MLEAENPRQLRCGAAVMGGTAGSIDQEVHRMDSLVADAVIAGPDKWVGEGASAFLQAFRKQVSAFRTSTTALREAANVLNWLADKAEDINQLRDKARALQMEADRIVASAGPLYIAAHARAEWLRLEATRCQVEADANAEIADVEGALRFGRIQLEEWGPKALAELDQVRRYVTTGFGNLAAHPGATIDATLEVVGGGLEAAGGAAFGVVTSETVVGTVVGGAVAVDGGAHVASGVGDLASVFNGDMNAVGTHNPLKNAFEAALGRGGGVAYEVMSFGMSFVAPEGLIAHASQAEQLAGLTPVMDAAAGVSQKVRELWEGLSRYRFGYGKVQAVTPDGQILLSSPKSEGSVLRMAKVEGEGAFALTSDILGGIKATDVVSASAEDANAWWLNVKGYTNSPYKPHTTVYEFTLKEETRFVRVYDGENSGQAGGWMMKESDIRGLSPAEIRDKYALPQEPRLMTDVVLPAGTKIRGGVANPLPGWGTGGGIQYDLMGQRVGSFINERSLP